MSQSSTAKTMRDYVKMLADSPSTFTGEHCEAAINEIMNGKSTDAQCSAFLALLKAYKLDLEPEFIAATARAMKNVMTPVTFKSQASSIDIVGTGGDGKDTFNVSTASSMIAAACGCVVSKHGNRASSSASGSADVLEYLGCKLANVDAKLAETVLNKESFCFLFAPNFHKAMGYAAKVRKEIGFRTIFNLVGPLSNPANPARCVVGVARKELGRVMADALILTGVSDGWVVCGNIGLDEISPDGNTTVWAFGNDVPVPENYKNDSHRYKGNNALDIPQYEFELNPERDFGVASCDLSQVSGGDVKFNAEIMNKLLKGELAIASDDSPTAESDLKEDPIVRFVALNSAAVVFVSGQKPSLREAVSLVRKTLKEKKAIKVLETFKNSTQTVSSA